MLHDSIVQRSGGTHGARQRERTEPELAGRWRRPAAAAAIAVDARGDETVGPELDRVLRPVGGSERSVVAPLELDELPGRAGQRRSWFRSLSRCPVDDCRAQGGSSERNGHDHAILPHRTRRSDGGVGEQAQALGPIASEPYNRFKRVSWERVCPGGFRPSGRSARQRFERAATTFACSAQITETRRISRTAPMTCSATLEQSGQSQMYSESVSSWTLPALLLVSVRSVTRGIGIPFLLA
jgi:hypothetical protein